jgi:non-specific serine/threonine protein kinase
MPGDPSDESNPAAELPRLATLESRPGHSPRGHLSLVQPTPLVGRTEELEAIHRRLTVESARLLTLTGPAGVGKTRLALAAAAQLADLPEHFPDGVVLVDLTPVRDPDLVLGAIARVLGLLDVGRRQTLQRLAHSLEERRQMLVVLDNFEQVLSAAASLAELLAACPRLALLVTSRMPLRLRWEHTLRIAPLPVPDLQAALPPLDALLAVPSVGLLVSRARARRADFVLSEKHASVVAQLAVQLDGLPLALELAAARLDVLPLSTLTRRLGDRLRLLASGAPDAPERQQSLEAAIGWSYDLLSGSERRLFRCLGVFVGRVSLDAIAMVASAVSVVGPAEAVGAEAGDSEVREAGRTLPRLLSLAEKSFVLPLPMLSGGTTQLEALGEPLVGQSRHNGELAEPEAAQEPDEEDDDPEPAFGMLETVREYAEEQLAAAGELATARRAHAHYFLALAERANLLLRGRDQRSWYLRLDREQDNLRAALRWLLGGGDQDEPENSAVVAEREAGLRLAAALGYFWWRRGYHVEGSRWLEEALARTAAAARTGGDETGATDPSVCIRALLYAGALLPLRGEFARARAALGEALALAERRQDLTAAAWAHTYLGLGAVTAGEVAEAIRLLGEARRRWEAVGDAHGLGETRFFLGIAVDLTGDAGAAAAHYTAALEHFGAVGDVQGMAYAHCYLGVAEWKRGELSGAVEHIRAALRTGIALRDRWFLGAGAQVAVALVSERADPAARARLLGAADALTQVGGATFVWVRMPGGQDVAGLRERLAREGAGEWAASYRAGRALPFAKVVALALHLLEDVAQTLPLPETEAASDSPQSLERRTQNQSPLSAREQEVLQLVAKGQANKAIARQLFISPSTVNYYLISIFNKLGVDTRAQAVAVASQRGLL